MFLHVMEQLILDLACKIRRNSVPENEGEKEGDQRNYIKKDDGIGWRRVLEAIVVKAHRHRVPAYNDASEQLYKL